MKASISGECGQFCFKMWHRITKRGWICTRNFLPRVLLQFVFHLARLTMPWTSGRSPSGLETIIFKGNGPTSRVSLFPCCIGHAICLWWTQWRCRLIVMQGRCAYNKWIVTEHSAGLSNGHIVCVLPVLCSQAFASGWRWSTRHQTVEWFTQNSTEEKKT